MRDSVFGFPYPFQSTLSMRRATGGLCELFVHIGISIHALHEESDHELFAPADR